MSDHLSDSSTAKIIDVMLKRGDLSPISMDWIMHWAVICNKPELSGVARPMTRLTILEAMQNVFQSVRDVPVHRHPFVDVILASCQAHAVEKDRDGYEVVWHILADEMIMRMSEAQELVWQEEADEQEREGSVTIVPAAATESVIDDEVVEVEAEPLADPEQATIDVDVEHAKTVGAEEPEIEPEEREPATVEDEEQAEEAEEVEAPVEVDEVEVPVETGEAEAPIEANEVEAPVEAEASTMEDGQGDVVEVGGEEAAVDGNEGMAEGDQPEEIEPIAETEQVEGVELQEEEAAEAMAEEITETEGGEDTVEGRDAEGVSTTEGVDAETAVDAEAPVNDEEAVPEQDMHEEDVPGEEASEEAAEVHEDGDVAEEGGEDAQGRVIEEDEVVQATVEGGDAPEEGEVAGAEDEIAGKVTEVEDAALDAAAGAAEEGVTEDAEADAETVVGGGEAAAEDVDEPSTDGVVVEDSQGEEDPMLDEDTRSELTANVVADDEAAQIPIPDPEAHAEPEADDITATLSPGAKATAAALQFVDSLLNLLTTIATTAEEEEPEPQAAVSPSTVTTPSPFSRSQSEFSPPVREKEPGLMSLLSAFASGSNSRSQSQQTPRSDDTISVAETTTAPETVVPAAVGAVVALIHIFSQLAFTPFALSEQSRAVAIKIFKGFVEMLREAKSSRVRLTVLQFFFRLRVDRDHRLFTVYERYDRLGHIASIASIIGRTESALNPSAPESTAPPPEEDVSVAAAARARALHRDGRRASRGRDRPDRSASSRSRSRVASRLMSPTDSAPATDPGLRKPLWRVPEALPFKIPESDTPSDGLMSYDPETSDNSLVIPTSSMLAAFIDILCSEKDWEIMAYVLCHLPTLLANKHLFCGPKSRQAMTMLLETLCNGILSGELGKPIAQWPLGLRPRDAQGLAFHTLSVMIGYRDCFSAQQRHILVEVLMSGLSAQQSTVKACIQALSIAAFELPSSVRRFLPDILTKLSQIMTNASIATHIIDFLAIVGSLPSLYANFNERDFKMVFGVALQYLRLHNRPDSPESTSVLSQHVRIMSFSIVYVWFLAVKLADRPRHVQYITRQLLLANEGRDDVDEPTEVCFDWLARYTYSSGDPRPASSMLSEIIMKPSFEVPQSDVVAEKAWIVGNALVSIRAMTKLGWIEVSARRPSGLTRFLARVENIPMVGPGEVDPDTVSVPAILAMDRESGGEDDALYQVRASSMLYRAIN